MHAPDDDEIHTIQRSLQIGVIQSNLTGQPIGDSQVGHKYSGLLLGTAADIGDFQVLLHINTSCKRNTSTEKIERIAESIAYANGTKPFPLAGSSEEAVDLMKALMGMKTIVSNVNLPNRGQMPPMPLCSSLTMEQCSELFREMCYNTREYLDPHFDLDKYFQ